AETPKSVAKPGIQDADQGKRGEGRGESEEALAAAEAARKAQAAAGEGTGTPADVGVSPKGRLVTNGLAGLAFHFRRSLRCGRFASPPAGGVLGRRRRRGGGWEWEGASLGPSLFVFDTEGYEWGPAAEMIRRSR
ncbi:MAG: hypothetical protein IPP07_18475, partial [Holophagales bacterium]|nr:hypothetical protein [Holophagales bacterium]